MIEARRAVVADAAELIRLRGVMFAGMPEMPDASDWQAPTLATLGTELADPRSALAAFVVDKVAGDTLAACAVGVVQTRLGSPGNARGRSGYVFSVATDVDSRRRGYSRACMNALLAWFRSRGIHTVDLRASPDGRPLYTSLGFAPAPDSMRLTL